MPKKKQFNLIEVLISFVVIMFAMFVLVSFFSISNSNSRDSLNSTTISSDVNNLLSLVKTLPLESDDSSEITLSSFAGSQPTSETKRSDYPSISSASYNNSTGAISFSSANHTALAFNTEIIEHPSVDGAYLILHYEYISETNSLVKLSEYEVRIWHSSFQANSNKNNSTSLSFKDNSLKSSATQSSDINYITSSVVNMEISWPINKSIDKRSKKNLLTIVNRFTKG